MYLSITGEIKTVAWKYQIEYFIQPGDEVFITYFGTSGGCKLSGQSGDRSDIPYFLT